MTLTSKNGLQTSCKPNIQLVCEVSLPTLTNRGNDMNMPDKRRVCGGLQDSPEFLQTSELFCKPANLPEDESININWLQCFEVCSLQGLQPPKKALKYISHQQVTSNTYDHGNPPVVYTTGGVKTPPVLCNRQSISARVVKKIDFKRVSQFGIHATQGGAK